MFKDKVYEDMDDVEKMFEPFQYPLNDELAQFPDKLEITTEDLFSNDAWDVYGISAYEIVSREAKKLNLLKIVTASQDLMGHGVFEIQSEGKDTSMYANAKTGLLSHRIFLVKIKIGYGEQELEKSRKDKFTLAMSREFNRSSDMNKGRFNEIADIYGAVDVKSNRSHRGKLNSFISHMENLIEDKALDIRDTDLCDKFIRWILLYVKNGNLAALNNLTRVKIMMHEKRPIYSIEEKETQ